MKANENTGRILRNRDCTVKGVGDYVSSVLHTGEEQWATFTNEPLRSKEGKGQKAISSSSI